MLRRTLFSRRHSNLFVLPFLFLLLTLPYPGKGQTRQITLEDLAGGKLYPKTLSNLQWIGSTEDYSWIGGDCLVKASARTAGKRDTLLRLTQLNQALKRHGPDTLRGFPAVRWTASDAFTFRQNSGGKTRLMRYNAAESSLVRLNEWNENAGNVDLHEETSRVAYLLEDNVYLAVDGQTLRVTSDGGNGILNGSERVHREEWGINKGTFWSPAGNFLAFYRMDESMVADYPILDIDRRIAGVKLVKYPMAGETSHQVTIGVYDLQKAQTVFLKTGGPEDQFLTNIAWTPDEKYLLVAILNRGQDHMKMNLYDAVTGDFVRTLFEESHDKYVEPVRPALFLKKQPGQFIWNSRRNGFNHLYLYDLTGKMIRQLTFGEWEVGEIHGFDETGKVVFITGSMDTPLEEHLYRVNLKDGKIRRMTAPGASHTVKINPKSSSFLDMFSAVGLPPTYTLCDAKGNVKDTLLKGTNPLVEFQTGKTVLGSVKADDGTTLYTRTILPANFDPAKKYPVIVYVYGGPHSQLVTNTWLGGAGLYLNFLASQGYLVFTLDNRGTSNRGFAFENVIHRRLGEIEVKDQLAGVAWLRTLPYVEPSRMAVEGWSYGGFMTISLMLKAPGVFRVGICGGPVIDWKYYEVMYGERYMDTPAENPEGYASSSLLNYAGELKGRLLVIHGTSDPVVVWQHSLDFVRKSIEAGSLVDYFVYPGHEHGVGGKDRLHLYRKQWQYYLDHL